MGVQVVNQSIPVQLSIPGHSQPYTISVSLPDGDQSLSNGALSELKSQGNTFSRLLNGPTVSGGGGGVVLQSSSGNIFQIGSAQDSSQQQHPQPQYSLKAGLKPTQQVMVRPANPNQTNPVLVQMPGNINQPPIRIVRSLPVNHQQLQNTSGTTSIASSGLSAGVKTVSGAVASPQGVGGPPTPGVPSPASVTSPGGQVGGPGTPGSIPESPLFVQLHQNHGSSSVAGVAGAGDHHHYLQLNQKQVNLVNQQGGGVPSSPGPPPPQLINNQSMLNQTHLKIRPQRKQSL